MSDILLPELYRMVILFMHKILLFVLIGKVDLESGRLSFQSALVDDYESTVL